jgi:hypothetical protein
MNLYYKKLLKLHKQGMLTRSWKQGYEFEVNYCCLISGIRISTSLIRFEAFTLKVSIG